MAFGRRRDLDKKIKKNLEIISSIITYVGNKYINEKIRNKRDKIYSNDIIKMKNQIEYIINMDRKLKITYKKSNFDLYKYLTGSINFFFKKEIRKSNDINKYLNHYNKVNILINGKNNLIEN